MFGATPLDICMGINTLRLMDTGIFKTNEEAIDEIKGSENIAMADVIFEHITDYGFMHSSFQITEAVIQGIKLALPSIGDYLNSRLISVNQSFASGAHRAIKKNRIRKTPVSGEYGYLNTSIWAPENEMKKEMFEDSGPLQPMNLVYVDVPHLYYNTPIGFDFIEALV